MDLHDFPMVLGKSGCRSRPPPPPKWCAGLARAERAVASRRAILEGRAVGRRVLADVPDRAGRGGRGELRRQGRGRRALAPADLGVPSDAQSLARFRKMLGACVGQCSRCHLPNQRLTRKHVPNFGNSRNGPFRNAHHPYTHEPADGPGCPAGARTQQLVSGKP